MPSKPERGQSDTNLLNFIKGRGLGTIFIKLEPMLAVRMILDWVYRVVGYTDVIISWCYKLGLK